MKLGSKKLLMLGAGGHARVLLDLLDKLSIRCEGLLVHDEDALKTAGPEVFGVPVLGTEDLIHKFSPSDYEVINAVGSAGPTHARRKVFEKWKSLGFSFPNLVHPSAIECGRIQKGEGIQVMAGAIIQVGVQIGDNTILNTGASVDHDCVIGKHCHLAPGVVLSGSVHIGDRSHIGTGSTIIQRLSIASDSVIAAGTVVTKNLEKSGLYAGVPAVFKRTLEALN